MTTSSSREVSAMRARCLGEGCESCALTCRPLAGLQGTRFSAPARKAVQSEQPRHPQQVKTTSQRVGT